MYKNCLVLALGCLLATSSAVAQKRKVTVMDFGYATVRKTVAAIFGTDQDIGKGISDLLIAKLLEGGDYRIIERSQMDQILKEQNFSNSDRVNPATAAKIGSLMGVDTMIIGDITTFGTDDKHIGGGGGFGSWTGVGLGGIGINKNKTIVEITARLIDVNTGEILASVSGQGETQKSGLSLGGAGIGGGKIGAGQLNMGSSNFAETQIGKSVKLAVADLATKLDSRSGSLPPPSGPPPAVLPALEGVVADASANELIINVGAKNGVRVGDTLMVSRVDHVVKDPVTGKQLRVVDAPLGVMTVTSVDADSAVGKFAGAGAPKIGDRIKRPNGL